MSIALFITKDVSTTLVDKVLDEGRRGLLFIAEPKDIDPLERWPDKSTKTPLPEDWHSSFLDWTAQQCADFLKTLVSDGEFPSCRRFAILDEGYVKDRELLACNREEDDSVTTLRLGPLYAAIYLNAWYPDQWQDELKRQANRAAFLKQQEDRRKNRRAALARQLNESE